MRDLFKWPDFIDEFSTAAKRQSFSEEVLLETADGPLIAWERKGDGSLIYLSAGIHGDEPSGPLAALEMMEAGIFPKHCHWLICPALNPGGLATARRENRQGEDMNRDYLRRKTLEVDAHARWLERKPVPKIFISLHEDWETQGFYFYEINLGQDNPKRAANLLAAVSPYFPAEPGEEIDEHEVRETGWIYHDAEADLPDSWPEAIYLAKRGCQISFTLETPSQFKLADRTAAHISAVKSLLLELT